MSIQREAIVAEQARQAILRERERRGDQVVVSLPHKGYAVAGMRIPSMLVGYAAFTECTVQHESGVQCQWIDWAFYVHGSFRVVLQNDLVRPPMLIKERVLELFSELQDGK